MIDLVKDFMSSMELPEQFGSKESKSVYHVVATKDGSKLAVSLSPVQVLGEGKKPIVALILRFIEVPAHEGDQPLFKGFEVRQKGDYKQAADGKEIRAFRGEKHLLEIAHIPISGVSFHTLLADNNILRQLMVFVKDRVALAGGTMSVSDVTFRQVLEHELQSIPCEPPKCLFKLPTIKGYNDGPKQEPGFPADEQ